MELHAVGPDYEQTVGAINRYRRRKQRHPAGRPRPRREDHHRRRRRRRPAPRRLILGADAVTSAQQGRGRSRAAETEKWADVSRSADFPSE